MVLELLDAPEELALLVELDVLEALEETAELLTLLEALATELLALLDAGAASTSFTATSREDKVEPLALVAATFTTAQ